MKICWDNLEKIRFIEKTGNFRINGHTYYEYDSCVKCGEPYLGRQKNKFCTYECKSKSQNGCRLSDETKQKMSESSKGKKYSILSRLKMSLAQSGKNHPLYGKHHTEETKRKMSISRCGEKNGNWKGGKSFELYCPLWTDREYKHWIKWERDNNRCQNPQCKCNSKRLTLHHINYDKKDCRPSNLITLCNSCNASANADREWHAAYYTEILRRHIG